jgi:RimJ/RimL family protein N-acetyltransferase
MDVKLVEYDTVFLEASYKWLNDREIKELTMTPDISREGQKKWFDGLKERDDYLVKGVTADGFPVGVVGLKHIDFERKSAEYFGYIGEKEYWGKGIGYKMMQCIEMEARGMNLSHIYLRVLNTNQIALKLYKKNEFVLRSYDGQLIIMDKIL